MFEISLRLTPSQHVGAEVIIEELGAISISLHDAAVNPVFVEEVGDTPLWNQIILTALFIEDVELNCLQIRLENVLACPIEISKRSIEEQDWQHTWMQGLQPMQFGERLRVYPSSSNFPGPFAINIQLDPGLAFGTGTHATTALCLEWLANHPPINNVVIDFGCGSGILAIAAFYLGAKSVCAIDHDPQAILATRANAECNHVPIDKLEILVADHLSGHSCDVLIANVLLRPLIKLEQHFADAVVSSGKIILSGILQQQLEELTKFYRSHFNIDQIYSKNEWLLVEASRR